MGVSPELELELDLLARRVFETADERGVELDESTAGLVRYALVVGIGAGTRDRGLYARLTAMLQGA